MSNVNSATVSGNLTREPELKHLPSGSAIANLGIAVNRSAKKGDEYTEEVSYFDVTVFGGKDSPGFAGLCARKLKKGDSCTVQGELRQERWETNEGDKRSKVVIVARQIDSEGFFRSKGEENAVSSTDAASSGSSQAPVAAPAEGTPAKAQDDDIPF